MLPESTNQPETPDLAPELAFDAAVPAVEYPPVTREPFWTYVDLALAIGLMVVFVGAILIATGGLMFFRPSLRSRSYAHTAASPVGSLPGHLPSVQIDLRFALPSACFFFAWCEPQLDAPPAVAALAAGGLLLSPLVSGIASLLHTPEVKMDVLEMLDNSPVILALFGLMAVTITPLFEELLFRGFLQPLLSRSLGVAGGIALTAILFGSLHGPAIHDALAIHCRRFGRRPQCWVSSATRPVR